MSDTKAAAAIETKTVKSADGTEIYAEAVGDPTHTAIVFIHTYFLGSMVFDAIFADPGWTDKLYLIRYDMRGHGKSGKPTDKSAWESKRFCEDFDAVVKAFKVAESKPFVLTCFHPPTYLSGIITVSRVPYANGVAKGARPHIVKALPLLTQTTDTDAFQSAAKTYIDSLSTKMPASLYQACLAYFMVQPRGVAKSLLSRTQSVKGLEDASQSRKLPLLSFRGLHDQVVEIYETGSLVPDHGWHVHIDVTYGSADHMLWLAVGDDVRKQVLEWIPRVLRKDPFLRF